MVSIARVITLAVAGFACEPAQAACIVPSPAALVGRDFAGCCSVVTGALDGAAPRLRWVAVSWDGPPDGNLYVVNCGGTKIAQLNSLGYVKRLQRVPRIGRIRAVAVTYVPAAGTNIETQSVAILQYRSGRIHILWSHPTLDAAYAPLTPTNEEFRTLWRFRNGYSRIEAITIHKVAKSRRAQKPLIELYCLNKSAWRYIPCR